MLFLVMRINEGHSIDCRSGRGEHICFHIIDDECLIVAEQTNEGRNVGKFAMLGSDISITVCGVVFMWHI